MDSDRLDFGAWLLGLLVLAVGALLPLSLMASRHRLIFNNWSAAQGKTS